MCFKVVYIHTDNYQRLLSPTTQKPDDFLSSAFAIPSVRDRGVCLFTILTSPPFFFSTTTRRLIYFFVTA